MTMQAPAEEILRRVAFWRRARAAIVLSLWAAVLTAAARTGYRIGQWRTDAACAGIVAVDVGQPIADRIRALAVIHATIDGASHVIESLASEPGPVGDHARAIQAATRARSPSQPQSQNPGR